MRILANISCLALLSLATSAYAADPAVRNYAADTLRQASTSANPTREDIAGLSSASVGDTWTAANLFERTVRDRGTPLDRFNLASTYQQTGRLELAAALYRTVVADGQYTRAIVMPASADGSARYTTVNIADESLRRLTSMNQALSQESVTAAPADVESVTAAPADSPQAAALGRVSDAAAMARDAAAQP